MKKIIANTLLFLFGWKTNVTVTDELKKCVLIAAPHTSNWDFVFAVLTFWKYGIDFKFFVKDSYTKSFFLAPIARIMGAIGVDRSKGGNLVNYAINLMNSNKELVILIPAEGTRQKVEYWKSGFYHIAKGANVPIGLGYLDFKKKLAGIGALLHLSDDNESNLAKIQAFYKNINPKYPSLYNQDIKFKPQKETKSSI
ncbi:MAG: 1-acyl-sn-glycerol-3-phosphate acyltransferase [Ichthyobacteriaceae bacterium]|nr:1-acyl-sn-glycerol-3-phosphate acyltransferase [Ichthyobacteriaceae bacterium]